MLPPLEKKGAKEKKMELLLLSCDIVFYGSVITKEGENAMSLSFIEIIDTIRRENCNLVFLCSRFLLQEFLQSSTLYFIASNLCVNLSLRASVACV